jgi:hypothetical protein
MNIAQRLKAENPEMFDRVMELKNNPPAASRTIKINQTMSSEKGKRPLDKKETMLDVKIKRHKSAIESAEAVREKLKGKRLVPHPTMTKTYIIYV